MTLKDTIKSQDNKVKEWTKSLPISETMRGAIEGNVKSLLSSYTLSLLTTLKEEVDIIQAEEPSNFPDQQDPVYAVCGRLSSFLEEAIKEIQQ